MLNQKASSRGVGMGLSFAPEEGLEPPSPRFGITTTSSGNFPNLKEKASYS
jgi:hypothetical protein